MRSFIPVSVILTLLFISCEKSKPEEPASQPQDIPVNQGGANLSVEEIKLNLPAADAYFCAHKRYNYTWYMVSFGDAWNPDTVPKVTVNGIDLEIKHWIAAYKDTQYKSGPRYYSESADSAWLKDPINLQINGSSKYPSFTYTDQDSFPVLTNFSLSEDTLRDGDSLTITFNVPQDCKARIRMFQTYIDVTGTGSKSFTFSFDELEDMGAEPGWWGNSVEVHLHRGKMVNIVGKKYYFDRSALFRITYWIEE